MAEQYGADALRFNLITGNSPGNDMRFYTERCEAMRNFANKIWNASRFLMMNLTIDACELPEKLELEDKWILSKLNRVIPEVTENMERYELGVAAQKVYDFIWDSYCDWYIELTKTRLQGDDEDSKIRAQQVLCYVLTDILKLLHPFMPFITEEICQALPHQGDFLAGGGPGLMLQPGRDAMDSGLPGGREGHGADHGCHPAPPTKTEPSSAYCTAHSDGGEQAVPCCGTAPPRCSSGGSSRSHKYFWRRREEKQVCPKRAACWSPAMPAMGTWAPWSSTEP